MKKMIFWTPRILMIIFILFISMFAFDAFDGENSLLEKLEGFFIHLLPSIALIILLILSWRREWIGGIAFLILGMLYVVLAWGRFSLSTYLVIAGPLFLVSFLFLFNWLNARKSKLNHSH